MKLSDGRRLSPTRIWQDPGTDLAVMSLQGEHLAAARVGDSDRIEIGDIVLAIGSPFGLSHSVTHGIISAQGAPRPGTGHRRGQLPGLSCRPMPRSIRATAAGPW